MKMKDEIKLYFNLRTKFPFTYVMKVKEKYMEVLKEALQKGQDFQKSKIIL